MEKSYRIGSLTEMMAMSNFYGKTKIDKATMNLPFAIYLEGKIDIKRLESSIKKVLDESIMHTYLSVEDNQFIAHERENYSFNLEVENAIGSSKEERIENVKSFAQEIAKEPLPIFEKEKEQSYFKLFKIDEEYHILIMIVHHTFLDFASIMIVINSIFGYYNDDNFRIENNEEYSKFMKEELTFFDSEDAKKEEIFWQKELENLSQSGLEDEKHDSNEVLPTEQELTALFDKSELRDLAAKNRTSIFNVTMLIIHMAIAKVNGNNDTLTQYAISNRSNLEYRYTLGCLTRVLNNRINFDDDMNCMELNKVIRKKLGEGYQNRHIAGKTVLGSIPYVIANEDMGDLNLEPKFNGNVVSLDFLAIVRNLNFIAILIIPIGDDKLGVTIFTDLLAYADHSKNLIEAMQLAEKFLVNYPNKSFAHFMRKDIILETLDSLNDDDEFEMIDI